MTIGTAPSTSIHTGLIDRVTMQQVMEGAFEDALNQSPIWGRMDANGVIKGDGGGDFLTKNVHMGLPATVDRAAGTARVFSANQEYVNYSIPWANIEATDAITRIDAELNNTKEGKVKLRAKTFERLGNGLSVGMATRLLSYNAGQNTTFGIAVTAPASGVALGGLPTLFGYGNNTAASATGYNPDTHASTGTTVAAGDKEVLPSSTYYGVSTDPTAVLPGVTNKQTEANSPKIINETSTAFKAAGSTVYTWEANCERIIKHMATRATCGMGAGQAPDMLITTQARHVQVLNTLDAKYRVILESRQGPNPNLRVSQRQDLVIPYGGLELWWDFYLTAAVTYCLNSRKMQFSYVPQAKVIIDPTTGREGMGEMSKHVGVQTGFDMTQDAHLSAASVIGAFWLDPRWHAACYAFA